MNKKVVLTGGSGHLGYHIGKVLIKKKYKVLLLLRRHNAYTFELILCYLYFHNIIYPFDSEHF